MARSVSESDESIIRLLQRNARVSYAEISRLTGMTESTVRRRIDGLQRRGIIQFAMFAEPSQLGFEIGAMIGLRVDLPRLREIAEIVKEFNEVTFAAFLTGSFDVMLQVVVESQGALVDFLTRKVAAIEGVRSTETFVMPWIIKPVTSWVLPEHEPGAARAADDRNAVADRAEAHASRIPTRSGSLTLIEA